MVFHWNLSDSKSQVSRTRLWILAFFSNAVIWIVSTCPPTSKSSRPFINPLVNMPKAPITIGTIVTFMFHSFSNSLARSRYLSLFAHSFRSILWSAGTAKSTILQILFFFYYFIIAIIIIIIIDAHFLLKKLPKPSGLFYKVYLDTAVVWMVSILWQIFIASVYFLGFWGIVPRGGPITISLISPSSSWSPVFLFLWQENITTVKESRQENKILSEREKVNKTVHKYFTEYNDLFHAEVNLVCEKKLCVLQGTQIEKLKNLRKNWMKNETRRIN